MILPDGSRSPKLIELIKLGTNPYKYLYNCSQRYGECFKLGGTKNPTVFFSNPQANETIFNAEPTQYYDCKMTAEVQHFFEFLLGKTLFNSINEAQLQRLRHLLKTSFMSNVLKSSAVGNCMEKYGQLICDVTSETILQWKVGKPFYVQSVMKEITTQFMTKVLFGLKEGERYQELKTNFVFLMESYKTPFNLAAIMLRLFQQEKKY
ncbi:hypothetical protein C7B80_06555 [Cyanosarcina cf. burmensis CCALA 770]|nr:hypothetical protein C7B80_06555 [Cyanosarcina cf. burmensis CCALA 770]